MKPELASGRFPIAAKGSCPVCTAVRHFQELLLEELCEFLEQVRQRVCLGGGVLGRAAECRSVGERS
jgi:hypothetical protein